MSEKDDKPKEQPPKVRPLPSANESEQGLLCSFLLDPSRVGALCAERKTTSAQFHFPAHSTIYGVLRDMWAASEPIDMITLTQRLHDLQHLDGCGGAAMVAQLFTLLPTSANAESYLDTVHEKFTLREVIRECAKLVERAYAEQDDVPSILSDLAAAASRVCDANAPKNAPTMRELVKAKIDRMQRDEVAGDVLLTGIAKLDKESPIRLGSMPLICGMQKSGKSMLALSIAANVAKEGERVLYFSLEDPAAEPLDRLSANLSGVPVSRHFHDALSEEDFQRLTFALSKLQDMPVTIRDDVFDLSVMAAVIEQHKAQYPDLALVVIDYAQLVRAETRKQDTRENEVAKVSRTLRMLSVRLKIAILLLSQINQDGNSRESKALEQDCTAKWQVDTTDNANVRFLKIPFQRNGASQVMFRVTFLGHLARFENYCGSDADDPAPAPEPRRKKAQRY